MRQAFRFVIVLVVGLAACSALAHVALSRMTRRWFEADLEQRAQMVLENVRRAVEGPVEQALPRNPRQLARDLTAIVRDERVMGAQVCRPQGGTVAASDGFPARTACRRVGRSLWSMTEQGPWSRAAELPGGQVFLSAVRAGTPEGEPVLVVLVQDMSYVARREAKTGQVVWVAFGILAIGASLVTLIAMRLSWRSWMRALRGVVRGTEEHPEFKPLIGDVRELVQRLSSEWEQDHRGGRWTPERLKATLQQHLRGERIVIIANREPYIHEHKPDGSIAVQHPASGLVSALEPVMRACSGVWVAHGGGSADREMVDSSDHVRVPPGEESYLLRRVWLTEAEEHGYYYGFSNEGLWPLCHVAHTRPVFRAEDWDAYRLVNRRFAEAVLSEVDSDDPIILVQDYHFALVPTMIRERLPRATILSFWHIPWPNPERLGICPWRDELLEGMLGASILGFHTQQHCNNFLDSVDTYLEARIDREQNAVVRHARSTLVRPYPISIEWPVHWLSQLPSVTECRVSVFKELGLAPNALLGVGVDRMDYTKGIEERLLAVERALERFPELRGRFTFVQLAAPSRTRIMRYQELTDTVEQIAERVNKRFGQPGYQPIVLLRAHHEPPRVFRFYRAANLCYVSSLHDGMNLVAKEFVAARDDDAGVLVLSHFTGAARELAEALIVNPYDLEEASSALHAALTMSLAEQRQRMRAMRALIAEFNVYRWAGRMLVDAAQLRRRERLSDRLSHPWLTPSFARPS